jgi:hypothetical protein
MVIVSLLDEAWGPAWNNAGLISISIRAAAKKKPGLQRRPGFPVVSLLA